MRTGIAVLGVLACVAWPRAADAECVMAAAERTWIDGALRAWELVRSERLGLPGGDAPPIVVFDARCRFETAADGKWSAEPHEGRIRLPDGSAIPAGVTSFTTGSEGKPPFFVMALPSVWRAANVIKADERETVLYGVFLHEYVHATHAPHLAPVFERLTAAGAADDIGDDSLQKAFAADPEYLAAWERERDLLYAAALEPDPCEARRLAAGALAAMRERQARWLTGETALWSVADDLFLTMEGVGQWTGYAWLVHPEGGALDAEAARETMRGRRRWWSQDEGLGLYLVIDRFLPGWQSRTFATEPELGIELLEEIVGDRR